MASTATLLEFFPDGPLWTFLLAAAHGKPCASHPCPGSAEQCLKFVANEYIESQNDPKQKKRAEKLRSEEIFRSAVKKIAHDNLCSNASDCPNIIECVKSQFQSQSISQEDNRKRAHDKTAPSPGEVTTPPDAKRQKVLSAPTPVLSANKLGAILEAGKQMAQFSEELVVITSDAHQRDLRKATFDVDDTSTDGKAMDFYQLHTVIREHRMIISTCKELMGTIQKIQKFNDKFVDQLQEFTRIIQEENVQNDINTETDEEIADAKEYAHKSDDNYNPRLGAPY
jgi:hypothetical protein